MTAEAFGGESVFGARGARLLFVLILILRVGIAAQFTGNFDTESYLIVADAVLTGQNAYQATDRYNYSPVWSFVVAGLWASARPNPKLVSQPGVPRSTAVVRRPFARKVPVTGGPSR